MHEPKIGHEFLKILRENAFNGMDIGDVIDHITRVVKITKWIKIPDINKNQLRIHVFSKSLSNDVEKWWDDEIKGIAISWDKLKEQFFHKYYPLSKTCNSEIPDDLDNGTDYFEFLYWLASKFDNHWEIDKTTRCGLWEFYVNEHTKGTISDLHDEPLDESSNKTLAKARIAKSSNFYARYDNDTLIYNEESSDDEINNVDHRSLFDPYQNDDNKEDKSNQMMHNNNSSTPENFVPNDAPHFDNNKQQNEGMCRVEKFKVIKYSVGNKEEFLSVRTLEHNSWAHTIDGTSKIYLDIFRKKDEGPVNTAAPKSKVNDAFPKIYSYFKAHSLVRRAFNQKSTAKINNFNEKVNTARVNNVTTAGSKAVVSAAKGNEENVVKSLACWIWRPTGNVIDHTSKDSGSYMLKRFDYGNPQYTLQDQGIFDSGCSRHMTRNKSFLIDYPKIDGGFVAFGGSTKGVIMLELALTGNPQQEVVNFLAKGVVDPKSDA
ncbi:hypothetical protein Tco_0741655 [Tanacetum coccineum]